ncbi:putative dual specificity protein phosphatase DSP8 [Phalaenopsis equestris]|uniref:putative dual specificity protein phosphatase DSP8 n=1 Tax=Phalaenopsis equestris TaxID=78828 RepID=UPI0009E34526|nr:putative dual specificity protein phosphatase DSP8 [Phalaenopsis equestris]
MRITELEGGGLEKCDENEIVTVCAKRVLVGAGARVLFYPTLLYNVIRNKFQAEFRWWDEVDQHLLLGAVPFPKDVLHLQELGVRGVVTLNEPYETLVPSSLYKAHGIDHLVIPTRDYLFAPSVVDISRAVNFIHRNASSGRSTYVHCKAGRGRSTTIVLCYLIKYKNMTPTDAFEHVRSKRPRVLLAPSQWQAVQEFGKRKTQFPPLSRKCSTASDAILITEADIQGYKTNEDCFENQAIILHSPAKFKPPVLSQLGFTIGDEVLITYEDLEGYDSIADEASEDRRNKIAGAGRPMVSKLSCFFSTLKISPSSLFPSNRLQEVQAC